MRARKILDDMKLVYASCKSYQDTGVARSGDLSVTFRTFFRRPNKLLVEFRQIGDSIHYAVWTTPGVKAPRSSKGYLRSIFWDSSESKPEVNDLQRSLAGATGISLGGASTVPGFLFPKKAFGVAYVETKDFVFSRQEQIEKNPCDVISSKKWGLEAWVSKKSHLLMREVTILGGCEYRIDYQPNVNIQIPNSALVFRPNGKRYSTGR
jgi:hypothetical protein